MYEITLEGLLNSTLLYKTSISVNNADITPVVMLLGSYGVHCHPTLGRQTEANNLRQNPTRNGCLMYNCIEVHHVMMIIAEFVSTHNTNTRGATVLAHDTATPRMMSLSTSSMHSVSCSNIEQQQQQHLDGQQSRDAA